MCLVEHQLEKFKSNLPIHLDLAPLIFVYNEKVNIRFRMDEKRFDVDGALQFLLRNYQKIRQCTYQKFYRKAYYPCKMTIVYLEKEHERALAILQNQRKIFEK
jgi:hypothetical protein